MRYSRLCLAAPPVMAVLLLAGCGGGGGGGGSSSDSASVTLSSGVYYTRAVDGGGNVSEGATYVAPDGAFAAVFDTTDLTFGTLNFSNGSISGQGADYFFTSSWNKVTGSLSGTVQSSRKATLKTVATGNSSTITLEREDDYSNLGLSLSDLNATFTMVVSGATVAEVTIAADGSFTGSDGAGGCTFTGNLNIPNTKVNLFTVKYTADNCLTTSEAPAADRNGTYTGIGSYTPADGEILFVGNNGTIGAAFVGTRM